MFADDVSLFGSHPNKEVAEAAIQEAITNVAEWSRRRKLTINARKCEAAFFTNTSKEARWQSSLQLDGPSQHNPSTEVPRSCHRQGPFLRAACRRSGLQSL